MSYKKVFFLLVFKKQNIN